MAIRNLFKNITDDMGPSEEVVCPKCHQLTTMQMYSNYDSGNYIAMILKKNTRLNFAVCPKCATVFKLSDTYAPGTGQTLRDYHFIPLAEDKE